MNTNISLLIHADGGSRGNPGEAAYGFVVYDESRNKLYEEGKKIGINTNNVAEYSGVVAALKWVKDNAKNTNKVSFFLDSKLAVEQLNGRYKVKNENLRNLFFTVKALESQTGIKATYSHVMRELNKDADRMVNIALDSY